MLNFFEDFFFPPPEETIEHQELYFYVKNNEYFPKVIAKFVAKGYTHL
jgi:hypothetical protein